MGYCIVYLHLSFIVLSLLAVTNFSTFKQSDEFTWFPFASPLWLLLFFTRQGQYPRLMATF